jgi:microcystin-dependent protein
MAEPFVGEIRMFGGDYPPLNWAFCNGQTLSISANQALFTLIGTTYGGDGVRTFALPNLQGRLPIGQGQGPGLTNRLIGTPDGQEQVLLATSNLPSHNHTLSASTVAANGTTISTSVLPGKVTTPADGHFYTQNTGSPAPTFGSLNLRTVAANGGGLPHSNLMPSLCVSFIIALSGLFPSRP